MSLIKNENNDGVFVYRAVKDLRWIAEATYTGEALSYALNNTIKLMRQENRVVLVLTDGRSDIIRDKVPLDVLCGNNVRVSTKHRVGHVQTVFNDLKITICCSAGGRLRSEGLQRPSAQQGAD